MDHLSPYGWTDEFYQKWLQLDADGLQPARVVADFGTSLKVVLPDIRTAELTGKLAHHSNREDVPKVGDWVAVRLPDTGNAIIESVIPRRSEIARKVAGKRTEKQVIAANVDIAFVVLALDDDFSIERLERFLYQLSVNAIRPVIVLNKADKPEAVATYTEQLHTFDVPVIITVATQNKGTDEILNFISPGQTAIFLGSSGVGKSTLTNKLLGRSAQQTRAVRASDSTGRHTTVHRELFMLPGGGLLVDTPGIRELQLWGAPDDLDENFDDILLLSSRCKYSTCRHGSEPGCAIQDALHSGALDAAHYQRYCKMRKELKALKEKSNVRTQRGNRKSRRVLADQAQDTLREMRDESL